MEEIEDGHHREANTTHPDRYRETVAEAAARFAQFQNVNETPKNPEEKLAVEENEAAARFAQFQNVNEAPKNPEEGHAMEGNRENVAEAAARFAQSQNAFETHHCGHQRRGVSIAMCSTILGSPHQKKKNPGEEVVAERKENNLDFCESIPRELAGGAKQGREDEERIMIEYLKKTNDSLDEIAAACEKAGQLLERVEKSINRIVPIIEQKYRKSAAVDATATGSGGEKPPLASVNKSRAEQRDSPKGSWIEEEVESDSIRNEVGLVEREGAFEKKDLLAEKHYRRVRESAPSPEPRRGNFNQDFSLSDVISSRGLYER